VSRETGGVAGGDRQALAAPEPLFTSSRKSLKQVSVQSARILPKPDFGITPEVQSELDRFMTRDRSTVNDVLEKHSQHSESLGKLFEGEGVPVELLTVAAVESGYNSRALSPAGARGMWQFMKGTARSYGLLVSARKDERLDPVRSTMAAAKHLRSLFLTFNDWGLALAAYNAGAGAISRTISRSGDSDFWELSRSGSISGETRRFVPKVIALSMIVQDPERFGFNPTGMVG
jgi:membrane-bound lytic murein transglycosylase D